MWMWRNFSQEEDFGAIVDILSFGLVHNEAKKIDDSVPEKTAQIIAELLSLIDIE